MKELWKATLNEHSPRFKAWRDILGPGESVPISSPYPTAASLGIPVQEKRVEVYHIDDARLSKEQRDRLVAWVVVKFGAEPTEVFATLAREGFPIRAEDVVVSFSLRAFL